MVTATSSELNTISTKLSGVVDSLSSSTIDALKSLGENQSAELQELASKYASTYALVVVAAMNYAEFVEACKNKDVLVRNQRFPGYKYSSVFCERSRRAFRHAG